MKQHPSHISTRSRILLVAILAIIVPTVVLSLFGLRLITQQAKFSEERLIKTMRTAAELTAHSIVQEVKTLEEDLFEGLPLSDPGKLRARLESIEKEAGLAEQVFLLNAAEEFVYPVIELPAYVPPRASLPAEYEITAPALRAEGNRKEFVENELPAALDAYMQYRQIFLEWYEAEKKKQIEGNEAGEAEANGLEGAAEAAGAIHLVASLLFKMGDYERCIAEYSALAYTPVYRKAAFDLNILARYQIGRSLRKLGRNREAGGKLLDLYEVLLSTKPREGGGERIEYYRERVVKDLDAIRADGLGDAPAARYELLKKKDLRRRERLEFLRNVKRWWQYRRKFLKDETPPATLQHTDPRELGMEPIVSYQLLREGDDYSLLGCKVSLDHVIREIASPRFKDPDFRGTVKVCVIDDNGFPVYGSPAEAGGGKVEVSFPRPFDFWTIRVAENDPLSARRTAGMLTIVYTSLNLVIVGVIVAGVYLTIKDMNRELELTKMKSDFVSNVSHELKTPLALIRMFSETLLMGRVKDRVRRQEYYDVITRESERLTALINNVLNFSKIDAGQRTYEMELTSVSDIIKNTLGAYRYELSKENFEVEIDVEPDLPDVVIDDDAISQALLNLLNNAVKYSGHRKEVKVSARRSNAMLHISVTDSGIGISPEDQRKIFDMFYRGNDENVRSTRGTGLGLAITKHTAEAHGGTVLVKSIPGRGSTFTIVLPLRQQEDEPEA